MEIIKYSDLYEEGKLNLLEASRRAKAQFQAAFDAKANIKELYGTESQRYKQITREAETAASILNEMKTFVFDAVLDKAQKKRA